MKKLIAIAFIGVLALSCSKKDNELQDSNIMLEEPAAQTEPVAEPIDQGAESAITPTAEVKAEEKPADSIVVK